MRKRSVIPVVLLVLPSVAQAHGLARYVSTPITPPLQLLWVLPTYALLFLVGNVLLRKRAVGTGLVRCVLVTVGFILCFAGSFYFLGASAAQSTTAPPPGLGPPHPAFWGLTWHDAGGLFVSWNVIGLFILGAWSLLFFKPWASAGRSRWALVISNLALYLLCLLPYAVSGAWLHGWEGGYVRGACDMKLGLLNCALVEYAETHDGYFPSADTLESLLKELEPHLTEDQVRSFTSADICPVVRAYERAPQPYVWNTDFSGTHLGDIDPDQFLTEKTPIFCPYHERTGSRTLFMLTDCFAYTKYRQTSGEGNGP